VNKKRVQRIKKFANGALALISSVVKAILIWFATRAIESAIKTYQAKISIVPIWTIFLAVAMPNLALFLAAYLVITSLAAIFYLFVWGNTVPGSD